MQQVDIALTHWINKQNTIFLDNVMMAASGHVWWMAFYALLLFLLYKTFQKNSYVYLLGIALTVLAADQLCTTVLKPTIQRLRPCHEPMLQAKWHVPYGCGGMFGMASSHAANTFAVAMFIFLALYSKGYRNHAWVFMWPIIVSYSRVYLGVHYVGDVLVGGVIGSLIGYAVYNVVSAYYFTKLFPK